MILLDEVIDKILVETGQVFVPISSFNLDFLRLEDLFVSSVKRYEFYRPLERVEIITIPSSGYQLPTNVISVASVAINTLNPFQFVISGVPRIRNWFPLSSRDWEFNDGRLFVTVPGTYRVRRFESYAIDYQDVSYVPVTLTANDININFRLKSGFKPKSLTISCGDFTAFVTTDNKILGTLGTGVYDPLTRMISLALAPQGLVGSVSVAYKSNCLGVDAISLSDIAFYKLFKANFVSALSAIKNSIGIEGLPIRIGLELPLSDAKSLMDEAENLLVSSSPWYRVAI